MYANSTPLTSLRFDSSTVPCLFLLLTPTSNGIGFIILIGLTPLLCILKNTNKQIHRWETHRVRASPRRREHADGAKMRGGSRERVDAETASDHHAVWGTLTTINK